MYPMGMVQKYWDTKNEPVSTRHGIQNLTVWPMAVCHNICACTKRSNCTGSWFLKMEICFRIRIDYSFNLYFQTWTLFWTHATTIVSESFIETCFPFKPDLYTWHQPKITMPFWRAVHPPTKSYHTYGSLKRSSLRQRMRTNDEVRKNAEMAHFLFRKSHVEKQ